MADLLQQDNVAPESAHIKPECKEKVLCIRRADFPLEWVARRAAIKMGEDAFFSDFLKPGFRLHWLDRSVAETDSRFKQIIPYILIQADNANLTAIYKRKGSEKRLHDLWSIGIGGHINPLDNFYSHDKEPDFRQLLYAGMSRELDEELVSRPLQDSLPVLIGTVNEELTDVGKVHFGVVFRIMAGSPGVFSPGEELVDFRWIKTEALFKENATATCFKKSCPGFNLELWSEMAMELF
ncbi:MAG: phosphoesterase [Desulfamplus sp.]|nr:phosphoesterase [Desulfamplus sp.]